MRESLLFRWAGVIASLRPSGDALSPAGRSNASNAGGVIGECASIPLEGCWHTVGSGVGRPLERGRSGQNWMSASPSIRLLFVSSSMMSRLTAEIPLRSDRRMAILV